MQIPVIRIAATIVLLVKVAHHSHWSVTVCLTLSALSTEIQELVNKGLGKRIVKLERKGRDDGK